MLPLYAAFGESFSLRAFSPSEARLVAMRSAISWDFLIPGYAVEPPQFLSVKTDGSHSNVGSSRSWPNVTGGRIRVLGL